VISPAIVSAVLVEHTESKRPQQPSLIHGLHSIDQGFFQKNKQSPNVGPGPYLTGENIRDAFYQTVTAGSRFVVDLWAKVLRMSIDRRFFMTEKLFMGTRPILVEEGDVIAIFCSQLTPFVLRPKVTGYSVVGACYAQGIMAGEAVPPGDASLYDIILYSKITSKIDS
jgi:hypothetical protein